MTLALTRFCTDGNPSRWSLNSPNQQLHHFWSKWVAWAIWDCCAATFMSSEVMMNFIFSSPCFATLRFTPGNLQSASSSLQKATTMFIKTLAMKVQEGFANFSPSIGIYNGLMTFTTAQSSSTTSPIATHTSPLTCSNTQPSSLASLQPSFHGKLCHHPSTQPHPLFSSGLTIWLPALGPTRWLASAVHIPKVMPLPVYLPTCSCSLLSA